jgi:LmbE family N-acetylglucosaminyl deacetylase
MRYTRRFWMAGLVALVASTAAAIEATPTPVTEGHGAVALALALRRLPVMGTVLWITAHPDDESNASLVALGHGRGLRTVVLTTTRGEGGQNEIGPELGDALGLLRVAELASVHRWDGAEQLFARAYDFGYSFSVDETYEKWGREDVLADLVRGIRAVRPDVIVTLPLESNTGGQHHQAAARLAVLAFRAAADVKSYPPETNGGLAPWQPRKIYESTVVGQDLARPTGTVRLRTGDEDPLLGTTPYEYGWRGRSQHRTQGMTMPAASTTEYGYTLVDSEPKVTTAESDLLDGVDTSWQRLLSFAGERERPALEIALPSIEAHLAAVASAFDAQVPEKTLPPLRAALAALRRLREDALVADWDAGRRIEIVSRLQEKETELVEAIALAHGLVFEPQADDGEVVPGQTFGVSARVESQGRDAAEVKDVVLRTPPGWTVTAAADAVRAWHVHVAEDAPLTRPYGRKDPRFARYETRENERVSPVFPPPELTARLLFTSGGLLMSLDRPVLFHESDARGGLPRSIDVLPPFSVETAPDFLTIPKGGSRPGEVRVRVRHDGRGAQEASCRLHVPAGWKVRPARVRLHFARPDEEKTAQFALTPPATGAPRCTNLTAEVDAGGVAYQEGFQSIAYPHIARRYRPHAATVCAYTLDVRTSPQAVIGYVAGVGDGVPEALAQLGVRTTSLTADEIAHGDLSRYQTILTGVRAYQTRPELKQHHQRLLEYMQHGGHVVVQYNKMEFNDPPSQASPYAPYPALVGTRRITDEASPVSLLAANHPLLTSPNRIGPADFEGWVQDRAVYLLDARDSRYEELLASHDAWPLNPGEQKGLLVTAPVGRGTWTYVGLALWRQLQAGVPGAYRLLANLVSQP